MNKKIKIILGGLLMLVIAVLLVTTVGNKNSNKDITFGMIANLTGDYAFVGENFAKGVDLAQEKWNKDHPTQLIKVIKEDDGFNANKGLSAYKKLTSIDHVDGLINATTITIDALYGDVVKSGMPVALGFEQSIEAKDDNVVQLWPGTVPAEVKLGQYIKEKGFKNVVMFVGNSSAALTRFANGFKQGYGSPTQDISVSADGTELRSSALKAVTLKPDAIVFITTPTSGAQLVKEINKVSKEKIQFIFDANMQTGFTDYKKILGDTNILNGSIVYTVPNIYRQQFAESYKQKYGSEAGIGSETGYNAFVLLAQSYNKDSAKWVNNMKTAKFTGADGQIVFDENGVRIPELKIGTIEKGQLPN